MAGDSPDIRPDTGYGKSDIRLTKSENVLPRRKIAIFLVSNLTGTGYPVSGF